jgi:hypothetical protein
MEAPPSAARLYAAAVGALLLVVGVAGFFGAVEVDAGRNFLYAGTGAVGLFAASYAPRPFALAAGLLFTVLAIWGFGLGPARRSSASSRPTRRTIGCASRSACSGSAPPPVRRVSGG